VLRLNGKADSYVDSNITLEGPFTVETWIRLDPGIGNEDGILGRPGGADFNFLRRPFSRLRGTASRRPHHRKAGDDAGALERTWQ